MMQLQNIALIIFSRCCISSAVAEIRMHCLGEGRPVYLIGGGPAFTTWNLQPVQKILAAGYRVCRWDMRGVGDNAGLGIKSQASALSQWIRDMHDVLPQEQVVLWGHSWGALQVMLFAKEYPERVDKLILSNPVDPALHSLEHIEQKRFNHPDTGSMTLDDMGTLVEKRNSFRGKIASYFVDAEQGREYAAGFTQQDANSKLNVRIWEEYRKSPLSDADVQDLSDKISGVIYCQQDVLQPQSLTEYRRLLSKTEHHVLAGCAHFPWEENPEDYYRVLLGLMQS